MIRTLLTLAVGIGIGVGAGALTAARHEEKQSARLIAAQDISE